MTNPVKVVTAARMAAIEQASDRSGVSLDTLMENAGLAVAHAARDELGSIAGARVVILVGPGNNGADGLVVARHLRRWGAEAVCCLLVPRPEHDPKLDLARRYDVPIVAGPEPRLSNASCAAPASSSTPSSALAVPAPVRHRPRRHARSPTSEAVHRWP